jgi:hypothetical protein
MNHLRKIKTCILAVLLLSPLCLLAQPPGFEEDVEDVPIDGGVTVLAAAAIAYGAKKMKSKLKNK